MSSIIVACRECGAKNRIPDKKQHLRPRCGKCGTEVPLAGAGIPVSLGDHDFQQFLKSASLPLMVDFYAPTCGPCQALAPVINSLARRYLGKVIIAKIDTSQHPGTAAHYQIRGVPTLLFFRNALVVDQLVGAPPESELIDRLELFVRS